MGGQESLGQETVGRHHGGNTAEPQFLGQPILQSSEHALGVPSGLGRVGRDQFDTELDQRPADLGGVIPVHLASRLGRVPIVAAPIRVEGAD